MIRFAIMTSLIASALVTSSCGGGSSAQVHTPASTVATISSISPTSAIVGSAALTLTLTGTHFLGEPHNRSLAAWSANGSVTFLATTFVSNTQLSATLPETLLASPITAQVFVETGDPMNDGPLSKSNSVTFSVSKPSPKSPSITSISPTSAVVGSSDLVLIVTGSNFSSVGPDYSPYVKWSANGTALLSPTSTGSTQLTTVIPEALLKTAITATVQVVLYDGPDDHTYSSSNAVSFAVLSASSGTASISPATDTVGRLSARQFAFTIDGTKAEATWVVQEGAAGGTITSSGLYTAPSGPGTYHIFATSLTDSSKNAKASVSVAAAGFTLTGSMGMPRSGHTATLLADGKVLVLGGDASPELFDPVAGTFTPTGSMTTLRYHPTATLLANGTVLIAGGFGPGTSQLPRLTSAELFDPGPGTFAATGSMAVGRVLHTATLLSDGRVLIAGGTDASGGGGAATASTEIYDPSTGTFTLTGSMASERADHTATLLDSGKVLIVGGWNGHAADSSDDPPWDPLFAELFDPASGTFENTGTMSTTRIGHSAIRLEGGKVLVLGGVPSVQNMHSQLPDPQYAEVYDPAGGTFASAGNFTISRTGYRTTLLTNGLVLVAGGAQAGVAVTWADLLDLRAGALTDTGGLITARAGHTATRLNDGRVLVTGGTDESGNALASAELYK